jgi:hypothetical protein
VLPCESSWTRPPPLARYLDRERCIPEYREELCGNEDSHLHRGDLARKSIDIGEEFGAPDCDVCPVWPLTGTDAVPDGTTGVYSVIGRELNWSDGLKPSLYLADDILLWKHRKGYLH